MEGAYVSVVIIVGPPGSGKDTQADFLVREMGMVQVPSSQIIQKKFAEFPDDPDVKRESERYDKGFLVDPKFVGVWIIEYVREATKEGKRLVFSGSPRTPDECDVELAGLDEMFGFQRVVVVNLQISEEVARDRIKKRRICRANKHPIPGTPEFAYLTKCPIDGSELYVRPLDDPKLLDERFREFRTLTMPTIEKLRTSGIPFFAVDGEQSIEAAHAEIAAIVERRMAPAPIE